MDWNEKKRAEAEATLRKWYGQINGKVAEAEAITLALSDDVNTPLALTELHRLSGAGDAGRLRQGMELLGLFSGTIPNWIKGEAVDLSGFANRLAEARSHAMVSKDFSLVGALKSDLVAAGVEVRMSKDGVDLVPGPDVDSAKLEALE